MMWRNRRLLVLVTMASAAMKPGASVAQSVPTPPAAATRSEFETRAELEEQARTAEAEHRTGEAWLLRNRLQKGDFQEGDRIVFSLHSVAFKPEAETLVVRAGKIIQMPKMDDLPLEGVLRSEFNDHFVKYLGRYLQDPEAKTLPLIRVGIQGSVGRPGYYYVSPDLVLNDVIMKAGGPAGDADLKGVTIRRGSDVIWDEAGTRTALTEGLSLDRLHVRTGDEVMVPNHRNVPWGTIFGIGVSAISLAITLFRVR